MRNRTGAERDIPAQCESAARGGDFSLLGSGASIGGGLQYHVSPTMALGGSFKWTFGNFSTVKLDNVRVDGVDISATTARFNLGLI